MKPALFLVALTTGLAAASGARADALSSLRNTLATLHGTQPIAGQLVVTKTTREGDDKGKTTHAKLAVAVADGGDGLQLRFAPDLLARAGRESAANAKDPDAPEPTVGLLGDVSPLMVRALVDRGPVLLRQLEGATLKSQRDEVHDGKPAQLLVFNLPAGVPSDQKDAVKHYEGTLRVWLGADGVPVATAVKREYKARKFLISFSFGNSATTELKRVGQRLVAVHRQVSSHSGGFGQSGKSTLESSFTLLPSTPAAASSAD